jgi:hypothetical protein
MALSPTGPQILQELVTLHEWASEGHILVAPKELAKKKFIRATVIDVRHVVATDERGTSVHVSGCSFIMVWLTSQRSPYTSHKYITTFRNVPLIFFLKKAGASGGKSLVTTPFIHKRNKTSASLTKFIVNNINAYVSK